MSTDTSELFAARVAARRVRAEWLAGLEQGFVTLADFLLYASDSEASAAREAVRRMRLQTVLGAALSSRPKAKHAVEQTLAVVADDRDTRGEAILPSKVRVAWLLDKRTHGKRIMALADSLMPKNAPPVAGFPFRTSGGVA